MSSLPIDLDDDVELEREKVHHVPLRHLVDRNTLLMVDLTKFFDWSLAVDRLCVTVRHGRCFGLLGVNGAGKSSTFRMLTGQLRPDHGTAYLAGHGIRHGGTHLSNTRHQLGYCPQHDALLPRLTPDETLTLFARVRGVPESRIGATVDRLVTTLLLTDHRGKRVAALSGGNKRKLSAAVALVGDPPLVCMDEPSTGMDPLARRRLWSVLRGVTSSGGSLLLTSHTMSECEAVCDRLAIMVNGQLKCLGSVQHLKDKYGQGATVLIKMGSDWFDEDMLGVREYIERYFPSAQLVDLHHGLLHYHVTSASVSWGRLFAVMERVKHLWRLDDYSVTQTSLEQVFLSFARQQHQEGERSQSPGGERPSGRTCCCL